MGAYMWISFSTDLKHWGMHKLMLEARRGGWWDATKIGLCNPPIETDRGRLVVYHGVRQTAAVSLYRLGLALFDLNAPEICLIRGDEWIMGAVTDYERVGDVGNVVFPCGHVVEPVEMGCGSITAPRISALLWRGRASAACWPGSTPMDGITSQNVTTARRRDDKATMFIAYENGAAKISPHHSFLHRCRWM